MITFHTTSYNELSLADLYDVLQIRQEIFVVEQNCPYLDADGKDQESYHLLGRNDDQKLVSYVRLVPLGVSYSEYSSIGRVVTHSSIRGTGQGKILMVEALSAIQKLWPNVPIKISAQTHLVPFYSEFGFKSTGEEYLEDDIPHTAMTYVV